MTQTQTVSALGSLMLVRLLAADKSPPAAGYLRNQLSPFFEEQTESVRHETFNDTINLLRQEGLIGDKKLILTDAGRAVALEFLAIDEPPVRANWGMLVKQYLVPRAIGLDVTDKTIRKKLGKPDGTLGAILAHNFELATASTPTATEALHALCWKGFDIKSTDKINPVKLLGILIGKQLGIDLSRSKSKADLCIQLSAREVGSNRPHVDSVRQSLVRRWLADGQTAKRTTQRRPQESLDLAEFAALVKDLARRSPTGRFGENRVFISHVWRMFKEQALGPAMTEVEFKEHLVEAHRQDLLQLSRADIVFHMDPRDVEQSAIQSDYYTFHFIQTDS